MTIRREFLSMLVLLPALLFSSQGAYIHSQEKLPPKRSAGFPGIPSFTAAPPRIQAGRPTTLSWSTTNAEQAFIGEANPQWPNGGEPILAPVVVQLTGSLTVTPSKTTAYRIKAQRGARSSYKDVTVVVLPAPPPTCTIVGQISGPLTWNFTDDRGQPQTATLRQIILEPENGDNSVHARLQGRNFVFTNVPAGQTYKIFPDHFRATPSERIVRCGPNITHGDINFRLTGAPPSG